MRKLYPSRIDLGLLVFLLVFMVACSSEKPEQPYTEGQRIVQPLNQQWKFALTEPEALTAVADEKECEHLNCQ